MLEICVPQLLHLAFLTVISTNISALQFGQLSLRASLLCPKRPLRISENPINRIGRKELIAFASVHWLAGKNLFLSKTFSTASVSEVEVID